MAVEFSAELRRRAAVHAALADPARSAIVDTLLLGDASPSELQPLLTMPSNLVALHLAVLARAGLVSRSRSEGDRRRTYLRVVAAELSAMLPAATRDARRVLFVCSQNSARSQLAVALWRRHSRAPSVSAGTRPERVNGAAIAAARRHRLPLRPTRPQRLDDVLRTDDPVAAVCDNVHDELDATPPRLHWSVADPVRVGTVEAFDHAETFMPEQQAASHDAATRVGREFDGILGMATVEWFLRSSHHRFAGRAAVPNVLPLLAERFARQCLRALANTEGRGHDGVPVVLFLCTQNAGRSQIAMAERGIDISGEYPKPRTDEIVHAADVVAGMGCGDTCPVLPGHRYEEWVLDDPAGRSLGDVRPIRDEIERRVRLLLTELGVPARANQPRRW